MKILRKEAVIGILLIYCFAVPFFMPIPIGQLEIGLLDFLFIISVLLLLFSNKIRFSVPLISLIGYLAISCISIIWIKNLNAQFQAFLRVIRLAEIVMPFVLVSTIQITFADQKKLIKAFAFGGGLSLIIGIIFWVFQYSPENVQSIYFLGTEINRAGGIFSDSGAFGHLISTWFTIIFFSYVFVIRSDRYFSTLITILCIGIISLIFSMSRGAMLSLLVVGLTSFLFISSRRGRFKFYKIILYINLLIILVVIFFFVKYPLLSEKFIALLNERFILKIFGFLWEPNNINDLSSGRISNWSQYIGYFLENPITGIGYKALSLERNIPPDNNYLAALVETGILGFAFMLTFLASVMYNLWLKHKKGNPLSWILFLAWIGQLIMAITSDVMTFWGTFPILLIITGAVLQYKQTNKQILVVSK